MEFLKDIQFTDEEKEKKLSNISLLEWYLGRAENLEWFEVEFVKLALHELLGILPIKTELITNTDLILDRIVINEEIKKQNNRLQNLSELRYPPLNIADKIDYNRASLKGQIMFYAGTGSLWTLVEVLPRKGQLITHSKWKLKEEKALNVLIICQNEDVALSNPNELLEIYNEYLEELSLLSPNTKEIVEAVYAFIIKAFTRTVSSNNRQGYLLSALLADLFVNNSVFPIDAICYPSVPNKKACLNFAIKPNIIDEKFDMIKASESIILQDPNPNAPGWIYDNTANCTNYNRQTLDLVWENTPSPFNI